MSDKFSLYQTDGLWGIIENASNEKQTSIKSYFGSDLIIKRLNEQADQIDQLKQQLEALMLEISKQEVEQHDLPDYCTRTGTDCTNLGKIEELQRQLAEKDIRIEELEGQFAYECECNMQLVDLQKQLEEKQNTIDEINKEFVQAVHDWKVLCAEKDKEIESLKKWQDWYSMWHEKFQKQIEDLITELETYRPTKLHGNGQCKCFNCNAINWTDWCSQYKGHIYCNKCLKDILKEEQTPNQTQLAIQELEKVKDYICDCTYIKEPDYTNVRCKIDQQIKELKGEKEVED